MAPLKRIAIAALLSLTVASAKAEEIIMDSFGYLNNDEAPPIINQIQAQDILNVDVTHGGKSIKKRSGYGLYKTLTGSQPIHGGHHFFDASGNDIQVWGSSTSLWGIVADATPVQLVSSATVNTTWDCADTQGFAYCVNSSRNALIKTNGATISWNTSPLGTMVAVTPERLLVAGVAAAPSTIYYSAANDFTNFTVGITPSSSSTEQIAAPGSRLTHIEYACGRWLWWKDQSFGYVTGTDQTNLNIKIVSSNIGTVDNASAIDPDGSVYFRGQDGHIYRYDCNALTRLSREITPVIQISGQRTPNSFTETSQSDFEAGSISPSGYLSTSLTPGSVVLSTTIALVTAPSFESGPDNSPPTVTGWTVTRSNFYPQTKACTGCMTFCGGSRTPYAGSYYFAGTSINTADAPFLAVVDGANNVVQTTSFPTAQQCSWTNAYIVNQSSVGATVKLRVQMANTFGVTTMESNTFTWPGGVQVWYQASGAGDLLLDNFITFPTTGTFYSAVHSAPNLTAWDTLSASYGDNGGSHTFSLRASTNSFTILSSTPSWTEQTVGNVISISTGTYIQYKDMLLIDAPTDSPALSDLTVNWFEGTAGDKAYAIYFKDAIWWTVAYGEGQSTNNYIFKYDLINGGWTLYNFGTGGFLLQNNNLYFGSTSADGKIYRYGDSTSDAGSAINAYWQSKDFSGSDPWLENSYTQIDTIAQRDANQTLTVGYTLSASTTVTTYNIVLSSTTQGTIRNKKLLPAGKIGGLINVKYSDTSATSDWEVLGFRIKFDPLPYRPTQ